MSIINFRYGAAAITITKFWTDFKAVVSQKSLHMQYEEDSNVYYIYSIDGNIAYLCFIYKGTVPASAVNYTQLQNDADKADWVNNYLPTANSSAQPSSVLASATVKAANTAPLASDTSLVTVISPNQQPIPVSGNFSVSTTGLAQDSTLTSGNQLTKISNGTNFAAVDNVSPGTSEYGLVTRNIPSGIQNITGSVTGSGNFTVIQGTASALKTSALITDGTNIATIKSASTQAQAVDTSLIVQISPNQSAIPISGTISATIDTTLLAKEATLSSLSGKFGSLGQQTMAASAPVVIASNQSPIPISGSISIDTSLLAKDATLTDGTLKSKLTDGTNTAAIDNATPGSTDYGLVVRNIPSGTQPISGTITANAGTGNFTVVQSSAAALNASVTQSGTWNVGINTALPAGSNTIGNVNINGTPSVTISGTPGVVVSGTVTSNIGTTNGLALDATVSTMSGKLPASVGQKAMSASLPVVLASDQSSLTINGTVTSDIGITNGLALDATLVDGTQQTKITDGTHTLPILNTSLAGTEYGIVVRSIPSGTQTISGSVNASLTSSLPTGSNTIGAVTGSGNFTVIQPTASNLNATVTGTVIANLGTVAGLALDTTISTMSGKLPASVGQKVMSASLPVVLASDQGSISTTISGTPAVTVTSGSIVVSQTTASNLNANVIGTVTSNIGTTNGLALDATLTSGSQLTQLSNGSHSTAITNATPGSTDYALVVRNIPSGTQTISGSVTANIGTTNGLALDSTLSTLSGKIPSLGSTTSSASLPVVIASDQAPIPISGTISATIDTSLLAKDTTLTDGSQQSKIASPKGMLFPGVISSNYNIATKCQAKFTSGTSSHNATFTSKIVSYSGGDVSWNYADGGTDTLYMIPGLIYEVAVSQINLSGTTVNDLQIFI